jgi:hypothetical protein
MNYRSLLTAAGILSLGVAAVHIMMSFSVDLSEFFGAGPKIGQMMRDHDPLIYLIFVLIIGVLALFGLYGLSGAGRFARLPLLKTGLFTIGAIYTLRGIALFPESLAMLGILHAEIPPQNLLSSAVSLATGLCFIFGAVGLMRHPVQVH